MKKKESEKMQQLESLISADAQNREDVGSLRLQLSGKVLRLSYFKIYLRSWLSIFYIFVGRCSNWGRLLVDPFDVKLQLGRHLL